MEYSSSYPKLPNFVDIKHFDKRICKLLRAKFVIQWHKYELVSSFSYLHFIKMNNIWISTRTLSTPTPFIQNKIQIMIAASYSLVPKHQRPPEVSDDPSLRLWLLLNWPFPCKISGHDLIRVVRQSPLCVGFSIDTIWPKVPTKPWRFRSVILEPYVNS